ncbi:non-specific lipid-transfer protein-like, partial [Cyprinodon tularosa]|uniref:non-specific lipid-transfer protein-like n=1 Tax=Cyprinodon tularosa TaxID=77115 RepID=UPI0018E272AC
VWLSVQNSAGNCVDRLAGDRSPGAKVALQHNIGLGGAVVVTIYKMGFPQVSRFVIGSAASSSSSSGLEAFKAYPVFKEIENHLKKEGENLVKKVGGVFAFNVKDGPNGKQATWVVDVKNGKGSVTNDPGKKADCTLSIGDEDLLALMTGKLNPQTAFFKGQLKITGNMGMAMKLQNLQVASVKARL